MRSSRMRGYGSWSIGWREGERNPGPPPEDSWGCVIVSIGFIILLLCVSLKTAVETGSGMAILIGLAIAAGIIQGMTKR